MSNDPAEQDFFAASEAAVADTELRRKLENATGRHLEHVAATRAEFPPYDAERDAAWKRITNAAHRFHVEVKARSWRKLFAGGKESKG